MVNYLDSKINKITSKHTDKFYLGSSTKLKLPYRLSDHVSANKTGRGCASKEIIDLGDYQIELIELYPCNSKDELEAREQYWMTIFKDLIVNKRNAQGVDLERKKAKSKAWEKENAYTPITCICGSIVVRHHMSQHNRTKKHINFSATFVQ